MFITIRVQMMALFLSAVMLFSYGCQKQADQQYETGEMLLVQIHIDAYNHIYINGNRQHLSRIQTTVEELREAHPAGISFKIIADDDSSIHTVNDVSRYVYPDPLQFASAAEAGN